MTIWVDADACPKPVREIISRAAIRCQQPAIFVANHLIPLPNSPFLRSFQVQQGFDVADNEIVLRCEENDCVVSGDIPLAQQVLAKHASIFVITPYGEQLHKNNIQQRLAMRNLMQSMRDDYAMQSKGKPAFSQQNSQAFANLLDKYLLKQTKP